jgi:hypothetical protein
LISFTTSRAAQRSIAHERFSVLDHMQIDD